MKTRLHITFACCAAMLVLGGVLHITKSMATADNALAIASQPGPALQDEVTKTTPVPSSQYGGIASPVQIPPLVIFTPSSHSVFVGEVVAFTNQTVGTEPIVYLWDLGDGVTSTLKSPTHIYNLPDTYTVTLAATNEYGTGFWLDLINVMALQRPVSVTIAGPATGRLNTAYTFTATISPLTTTQPITYVWQASGQSAITHSGGDWNDSATFTWTTPGSQAITVTASNVAGVVIGTHYIRISHFVYLPVVLREYTPTPGTPVDGNWQGTTNNGCPVGFRVSGNGTRWEWFLVTQPNSCGGGTHGYGNTNGGTITSGGIVCDDDGLIGFTAQFSSSTAATGTFIVHDTSCGYSIPKTGTWTAQAP